MSEPSAPAAQLPTDEQKRATVSSLRNIAGLINTGMFLGQNAQYVRESIDFLLNTAKTVEASLPKPPGPPDLKVCGTEDEPNRTEAAVDG